MTLAIAIEKRLQTEIGRVLETVGHARNRPAGLNEVDIKAFFIAPTLSALGWELHSPMGLCNSGKAHS